MLLLCINYNSKGQQYDKEISQICEFNLPTITPKFNKSRVDPQLQGRNRKFVSTLAEILFDGGNVFGNHKKQSALQKGMKKLLARQKVSEGTITALGTQMGLIAQLSLKEIERPQIDIVTTNKRLEMMTHMKLNMDKFNKKVNYNANSIIFLALVLGRISANMERNLSKNQHVLADLDHLMDGLDSMSSGLLSHTVITTCKLAGLLCHVRRKLI